MTDVKPGRRSKQFDVTATGHVTLYTRVTASSEKEAREKAAKRGVQGLCHQCSSGDSGREWSLTGELDCEPGEEDIVSVEEVLP